MIFAKVEALCGYRITVGNSIGSGLYDGRHRKFQVSGVCYKCFLLMSLLFLLLSKTSWEDAEKALEMLYFMHSW